MRAHLIAAALLLVAAGCATAPAAQPMPTPTATPPAVTPPALDPADRGVPGFDTRAYPGDTVMEAWLGASPYRWVGYYLPAPCHTDTTWVGRRQALERMGWGTAVIFTGEQDWGATATVAGPSASSGGETPRCTRANLNAAQGTADAAAADSATAAEGFPTGSTIYLDVERVDSVSTPLASYVRAWVSAVLEAGRFQPGLYAHVHNADSLRAIQERELARRGLSGGCFWVAGSAVAAVAAPTPASPAPTAARPSTTTPPPAATASPMAGGFDLAAAPAESGLPYVTVWQGAHDARQGWAGTTLRIDVNVASRRSPSAPPTP